MAFKPMNRAGSSYQAEDFSFEKEGDVIEGHLVDVATLIGKKGRMVGKAFKKYTLQTTNGYESFLGSTVLDKTLPTIQLGTLVRVTYLGYPEGKTYKDYSIEADEESRIEVAAKPATTAKTASDIVNAARVN